MHGSEPSCHEDFLILWQSSCFSLYSMDIIRRYNISFPSEREFISEDVFFNTDYFLKSRRVAILNEAFYNYCLSENSLTTTYSENRFSRGVAFYIEHLKRLSQILPDKESFNLAKERVQRSFLASIRYCIIQICASYKYKEARSLIAEICSNKILINALKEYPWNKNPLKYRVFNYALKLKQLGFLYLFVFLKK